MKKTTCKAYSNDQIFPISALPSASHAGVAFMAILALLVAATIAWFGYAYFFPNSWSGRLLIKVTLCFFTWHLTTFKCLL